MVLYPYQQEIFTREWEKQTQTASLQGANPPSQMDVWRGIVGVNKNTMYGYGLHSTEVLRPYYYGSSSSSSEWVQRQELNELRNQLEEVRTERDELRVEMANTKNTCEQNNKMIKKLMKMMKYQQPPTNEELYDEDDEDGDNEESNSEGQSGEES